MATTSTQSTQAAPGRRRLRLNRKARRDLRFGRVTADQLAGQLGRTAYQVRHPPTGAPR